MAKDKNTNTDVKVVETTQNDLELDLSAIAKKRVRINGDNTKIIYINPSDLNIVQRLNNTYPKLKELEEELSKFTEMPTDSEDSTAQFAEKLATVDGKMKEHINYIFDYDVCTPCCDGGSMYDPIDGKMRYEYIIEKLLALYETGFTTEFGKIKQRVAKHTSKYHK